MLWSIFAIVKKIHFFAKNVRNVVLTPSLFLWDYINFFWVHSQISTIETRKSIMEGAHALYFFASSYLNWSELMKSRATLKASDYTASMPSFYWMQYSFTAMMYQRICIVLIFWVQCIIYTIWISIRGSNATVRVMSPDCLLLQHVQQLLAGLALQLSKN